MGLIDHSFCISFRRQLGWVMRSCRLFLCMKLGKYIGDCPVASGSISNDLLLILIRKYKGNCPGSLRLHFYWFSNVLHLPKEFLGCSLRLVCSLCPGSFRLQKVASAELGESKTFSLSKDRCKHLHQACDESNKEIERKLPWRPRAPFLLLVHKIYWGINRSGQTFFCIHSDQYSSWTTLP